jgi:hypothetical protein
MEKIIMELTQHLEWSKSKINTNKKANIVTKPLYTSKPSTKTNFNQPLNYFPLNYELIEEYLG